MKMLLATLALFPTFVLACPLQNMGIYQIRFESDFVEISQQQANFPGYLFSQFDSLESFEYAYCHDAISEVIVEATDGERFRMIYTNEDRCDGGNSYGLVLDDKTLKPIALIQDSDVSCL